MYFEKKSTKKEKTGLGHFCLWWLGECRNDVRNFYIKIKVIAIYVYPLGERTVRNARREDTLASRQDLKVFFHPMLQTTI